MFQAKFPALSGEAWELPLWADFLYYAKSICSLPCIISHTAKDLAKIDLLDSFPGYDFGCDFQRSAGKIFIPPRIEDFQRRDDRDTPHLFPLRAYKDDLYSDLFFQNKSG